MISMARNLLCVTKFWPRSDAVDALRVAPWARRTLMMMTNAAATPASKSAAPAKNRGDREVWDRAEGGPHLRFWKHWMASNEAAAALETFNADGAFPWNLQPKLYGQRLAQHAYSFERKKYAKGDQPVGVRLLEQLCVRVEADLGCKVYDVFCNRFADPSHGIPWHQDKFGTHIAVLSLGSSRRLEFRHNKTKEVDTYEPLAGDLYFMSLDHNKRYHHRVCAADDSDAAGVRLSFVFFITPPFDASEYHLSFMDKVKGAANYMVT